MTNNLTIVGPHGTEATVNCTVYPVSLVDVSVDISSDKDEYFVDDVAVWTVVVHNAGNGTNATGVSLKDLFPSDYFEFVNCTDGDGNVYDLGDDWVIPFVGNGTDVTFVIYSVAVVPGLDIINSARVDCVEDEWDYDNNDASKVVDVVVLPEPVKTVSNDTPYYHDVIEYNLTVVNSGSGNYMDNLTVVDSLPDGLVFNGTVGIVGAEFVGEEVVDGQVITWTITNVTAEATITVRVKVNGLGALTNNLTIVGPHGTEATVNCTINPVPIADLEVIKQVSNSAPHKGDKITWTIIVTNNGPNTAVNAIVTDKLPEGLIYVSDDSLNQYDYKTGEWSVGDIASGESVKLNIETMVDTTNKTIINLADVGSETHDPNTENNYCNNSTTVPPEADLVITVEPDVTKVHVGDKVVYTITVKNQGPDTAVNSTATIKIPKELELLGFKPSKGTYDPNTGIWTIGDLAPGEEVTLLLDTKALKSGTIVVEASVECDTYDSDLTNNYDSAEIIVEEPPINETHALERPMMHATGNPIVMLLLALLSVVGITLKRKY